MSTAERSWITDRISYWKASNSPLSADVTVIKGDEYTWIFDVGNCDEVAREIEALPGEKIVILSHFHPDHIGNLNRITYKQLYQGNNTLNYTKTGKAVTEQISFSDGVKLRLFELPSSHAKGSIGLEVDETYAFLGDGTYTTRIQGKIAYNTQLLLALIRTLKSLKAQYIALSHDTPFLHKKDEVLVQLEEIYEKREKNQPYIYLP